MSYPLGTWTVNADNSAVYNGPVYFPAGTNLASGTAIVIFGPSGATANFPAVAAGRPGLSPEITVTMVEVDPSDSLPSPNPAVTVTDLGDPGTRRTESWTLYVHAGAQGDPGSTVLLSASDLEGTATNGYFIGYKSADTKAQWQPMPCGGYYYASGISATASNTNTVKTITSISVPARPFQWWPVVHAQTQVVGASDVRVDLVARLNANNGNICAYGFGTPGDAPPTVYTMPNRLVLGSDNIVGAGDSAVIYLTAENQTSSPNPWNTTTSTTFEVEVKPVPAL